VDAVGVGNGWKPNPWDCNVATLPQLQRPRPVSLFVFLFLLLLVPSLFLSLFLLFPMITLALPLTEKTSKGRELPPDVADCSRFEKRNSSGNTSGFTTTLLGQSNPASLHSSINNASSLYELMLCFSFRVLENACRDDEELRGVLGDSLGNPELMRKRVEDRVRRKGRDFQKSKTGSVLAFKVTFRK